MLVREVAICDNMDETKTEAAKKVKAENALRRLPASLSAARAGLLFCLYLIK